MTMTAPSFSQIKAQVAAIRQKAPQAKVIGIHSSGRWTGESIARDGDQDYAIHQCDSPLSFRIALRQPAEGQMTKVLITNLDEHDLGDDILLRLAKRRLFQIDPWQIVRALFDAHAVDPRLTKHAWIAESLLELIPGNGYPAARGGFLDAETVWPLLLEQSIGLQAESPDLTSLLKWSLDADATKQFRHCPDAFRHGAGEWLMEKAGPVAGILLQCVERLDRPDAVPIGLAAGVVYHSAAIGKLEKATGKLEERFLGGKSPEADHMQRWSAAATDVLRALRHTESKNYRKTVQRADEILREVQADPMAYLSDTSQLGFDQRLERVGKQLSDVLERGTWDSLGGLFEARDQLGRHDQSNQEKRRLERVDMALRLVRWLESQPGHAGEPESFADAASRQLQEGGFLDWARLSLRSGDPVRHLSEAYSRLFELVRQIREQQSQGFAKLLTDWTAAGSQGNDVIPVERALEQIVAPLAAEGLVLVIVVDGMSVAVCRELLTDVTRHEWIAISEPGRTFNRPGVAAIPSVTEFSRTSLLCGKLRQGHQADEKAGFAEHPTLVERSRSGSPPVLFHKAGLQEQDDSVLAAEVRKEIASTHRRVVGVVVNAVDDHLLKGEQIDTRWSRDEIKVLPALLHEARIARRLVVLLSDHGHVLDCQAVGRSFKDELAGGERWRSSEGAAGEDELQVEGSRVMVAGRQLIAPWSERVRYGIKKNGYHGGLTPQEMIVPIAVLSSTDDFPKGWSEQPIDTPAWWDEPSPISVEAVKPVPKLKSSKPQTSGTLFDLEEKAPTPVVEGVKLPKWVSSLLASPIFEDQKRLGGRGVPADEVFTKLLVALDGRGGKLTSVALARTLEFPAVRLPGLLAKAERILNVDGYDVLRRDDASDTIELNRDLLLKQFDLVE
ncbi:BREX-2 system phosphatase PglZ [Lignipirellula cremea]|uniref:PglZ domain protein n=1 Tax=Lignipirellula cremea TaxID=2528010 RepID=A0A518E416_9BACT|nr:BREX-2 system phosphatase PglZ [Lignipirellula cremea]QDU98793.1 PglZ domain protein [Lignipirellula cremea]